jgi:hypothetical protein
MVLELRPVAERKTHTRQIVTAARLRGACRGGSDPARRARRCRPRRRR